MLHLPLMMQHCNEFVRPKAEQKWHEPGLEHQDATLHDQELLTRGR